MAYILCWGEFFQRHFTLLKEHYFMIDGQMWYTHLFFLWLPWAHCITSKCTMKANVSSTMEPLIFCKSFHLVMENTFNLKVLWNTMLKYFKLVEIAIVQVLGNMEAEQTLSTLFFMKSNCKMDLMNISPWWSACIFKPWTFRMMQPLKSGKRWTIRG